MGELALFQNLHSQASVPEVICLDAEDYLDDLPLPELQQLIAHVNIKKNKSGLEEQITDGELLLQQTVFLLKCLKEEEEEYMGITPSDFINGILEHFDKSIALPGTEEDCNGFQKNIPKIDWDSLGQNGALIFGDIHYGCPTMYAVFLPSMSKEMLDLELECKELYKEKSTDKEVKRLHRRLLKEKCLVLDRLLFEDSSFSRAVENLFALSFLVRDGNAQLTISENGDHEIVPRNAPTVEDRSTGFQDTQFVFRLDYKEWKEKQQKIENIAEKRKRTDIESSLQNDVKGMESNVSAATHELEKRRKKINLKILARRRGV
ncbi:non-structural maintenance of chromosomes element 4 homolog B-like [Cryptomeria japonica]|uniref:non-structural maintenance of chromosomes element 4 homolog B-like n=1 Tax=Cryptomeria japonica TaxID=3369 RepID=UPI0027DA3243|nr:non-structural maintenance of chromosomes element 4 homolog B-like [Cryptomeria japonica]